jgi:hypothetical protein
MSKLPLAILTVLISSFGIGVNLSAQAAQSQTQTRSSTDTHSIALTGKRCGAARKYSRPHYRR